MTTTLQPATTTARRFTRRPLTVLATLLMAGTLAAGIGVGSGTASAYSQVGATGYPGSVSTPFIWGSWDFNAGNSVLFPWRTVTESTAYARYDQYVCVQMDLVYSSASKYWVNYASRTNCAWIPAAATSVNVNGTQYTGLPGLNSFIYAGNVKVTWRLSNGAVIGTRTLDYNATGDYRCSTINCFVGMTTWGGGAYLSFPSL